MAKAIPGVLPYTTSLMAGRHYSAWFAFPTENFPSNETVQKDLASIGVIASLGMRDEARGYMAFVIEPTHDIIVGSVLWAAVSRNGMGIVTEQLPGNETEWSLDYRELPGDFKGFFKSTGQTAKSWIIWAFIAVAVVFLIGMYLWRK